MLDSIFADETDVFIAVWCVLIAAAVLFLGGDPAPPKKPADGTEAPMIRRTHPMHVVPVKAILDPDFTIRKHEEVKAAGQLVVYEDGMEEMEEAREGAVARR